MALLEQGPHQNGNEPAAVVPDEPQAKGGRDMVSELMAMRERAVQQAVLLERRVQALDYRDSNDG